MNMNLFNCPDENKKENKKIFDFNQRKNNTLHSLTEVESFLRGLKKISKYVKLYKIIK